MPQAFAARRPVGVSLENPTNYRFLTEGEAAKGGKEATEATYRKLNQIGGELEMEETNSGGSITQSEPVLGKHFQPLRCV